MPFVQQVNSDYAWRPLVLLTAVAALFVSAGNAATPQSNRMVSHDDRRSVTDRRVSPRVMVVMARYVSLQDLAPCSSSQEPASSNSGLSRYDDSSLRRSFAPGGVVARGNSRSGYLVESSSARRIAAAAAALPGAGLPTCHGRLLAIDRISWPIGQTAAQSVVLLRRLLI